MWEREGLRPRHFQAAARHVTLVVANRPTRPLPQIVVVEQRGRIHSNRPVKRGQRLVRWPLLDHTRCLHHQAAAQSLVWRREASSGHDQAMCPPQMTKLHQSKQQPRGLGGVAGRLPIHGLFDAESLSSNPHPAVQEQDGTVGTGTGQQVCSERVANPKPSSPWLPRLARSTPA